jgi:hypothetical protein
MSTTRRRSAAALALSAAVTFGILGVVQHLATAPASDALMARQAAQSQVAVSAGGQRVKS